VLGEHDNTISVRGSVIIAALWSVGIVLAADPAATEEPVGRKPFHDLREQRVEYVGPGREEPAPVDVEEVRIGYFGPGDPSHPLGGDMWRAAQLAVHLANERGGYRGKPFRLVPGWSEDPWGTGVVQVTRMAYSEKVWAIVGGIDGPSTHLAEQVVAKARLALISPVSSDKTVNLANVPWMFSLVPGDHLQAPALAGEIVALAGGGPIVLVSTDDHDSRMFSAELKKNLARHRTVPRYQFQWRRGAERVGELAARVVQSQPAAVVVVAGPGDSARLVVALRDRDDQAAIFGGPAMGRRRFLEQAGPAAEGVVFPLLSDFAQSWEGEAPAEPIPGTLRGSAGASPSRGIAPKTAHGDLDPVRRPGPTRLRKEFTRAFERRYAATPDYAAAHTYDAVRLTIAAIDKAGLNRVRIRDALHDLSPWTGATGSVRWDRVGSNVRAVRLGTIRNSKAVRVNTDESR
jgi:ABC-type branched-subunit amino acid transport system substrate-binding protein